MQTADKVDFLDHLANLTGAGLVNAEGILDTANTGLMEQDTNGRDVLKHVIGCALEKDVLVTYTDPDGTVHDFVGLHGIAPEWGTGSIKGTLLVDVVGLCTLAYINENQKHVQLLTGVAGPNGFGPHYNDRDYTPSDYAVMGGVFYGHGLGPQSGEAHFWSCSTIPQEIKDALGDNGNRPPNDPGAAISRDCTYPNTEGNSKCGVHSVGNCGEVCTTHAGFQDEWGGCVAGEPNINNQDATEHPTYVYLLSDPDVGQVICDNGPCSASSADFADNRMIANVTPALLPTEVSRLECAPDGTCAIHIDAGVAEISAGDDSRVALICSDGASSCSATCTDATCDITLTAAATAGDIECVDDASCRLICMDDPADENCQFDSCAPGSEQICPGYARSKFCGRDCPGTCSQAQAGNPDSCGQMVAAGMSHPTSGACSCQDDCEELGNCCEDKYFVCGASLPIDTPTGHWKFDESGDNHIPEFPVSATLTGASLSPGAPALARIPNLNALTFDGVDDHAIIPTTAGVTDIGDNDFTVAAWVRASPAQSDVNADSNLVLTTEDGDRYPLEIRYHNQIGSRRGQLSCASSDGALSVELFSPAAFLDGAFHHVACTRLGNNFTMFIDGVQVDRTTESLGPMAGSADWGLGRLGEGSYFAGAIDDLRIYARALNARELAVLAGPFHWKFDDAGQLAADEHGHEYPAALQGGASMASPAALTVDANRYALHLDGVDGHALIPDGDGIGDDIDFGPEQDFAVTLWVQASATQPDDQSLDNAVLAKLDTAGTAHPFALHYLNQTGPDAGKVSWSRSDGSVEATLLSTVAIDDGAFHHVALVKRGEILTLYIDGCQDASTSDVTNDDTSNAAPIYLGRLGPDGADSKYFQGAIDELRIHRRALSEGEILAMIPDAPTCQ